MLNKACTLKTSPYETLNYIIIKSSFCSKILCGLVESVLVKDSKYKIIHQPTTCGKIS